ncbi:MAG: AhpC/TSA family protein [Ignavibacteriaceae bacterium]|jgi:thiol-disulfide isomerase/thioredoxin|nr:AhpC/TSA family protein [Ignavibacteriaceae bacterium]
MKRFIILVAVLLYFMSSKILSQNNSGFEIIGSVKGVVDSSWVFLIDHKIIDSSIVLNNKFVLKGKVTGPTNCVLTLKDSRDYKFFWVENKPMEFKAEKGNFLEAAITGSSTQNEQDILNSKIIPLRKQRDSLNNVYQVSDSAFINNQLNKLDQQEKKISVDFIKTYTNSIVSVHILNVYKTSWGKKSVSKLFNRLSHNMKQSTEGKSIETYIMVNKNPKIGDHFFDFELPNGDGKIMKLSEIKGKAVLLDFWASWCLPCREENKRLVEIYAKFHPKGFEIFGVSGDINRNSWLNAVKQDNLIWENVRGEKGDESIPFLTYGIRGIPDNFLINEDGKIIGRDVRGDKLNEVLRKLLNPK